MLFCHLAQNFLYILPATTWISNRCIEILAKEHTYKLLAAELKNQKAASNKRKREQHDDGGDEAMPEEEDPDGANKGDKPKRKAKGKAKAKAKAAAWPLRLLTCWDIGTAFPLKEAGARDS